MRLFAWRHSIRPNPQTEQPWPAGRALVQAGLATAVLIVLLAAGCAAPHHSRASLNPAEGLDAARPPLFLVGPVGVVLTNAQDYTARVAVSSTNGLAAIASGTLFQKEGWLLFVPTSDDPATRNGWAGTFRFLWDPSRHTGDVVSERLHGYTPAAGPNQYYAPIVQPPAGPPALDQIDGQPCVVEVVKVSNNAGEVTTLQTWHAEGQSGPPLRIIQGGPDDGRAFSVRLSDLNLDPLSPELFTLPPGFTRYDTAEAMIRQLIYKPPVLPYTHEEDRGRR